MSSMLNEDWAVVPVLPRAGEVLRDFWLRLGPYPGPIHPPGKKGGWFSQSAGSGVGHLRNYWHPIMRGVFSLAPRDFLVGSRWPPRHFLQVSEGGGQGWR